ncbi:MAG: hypothetical protein REH79_00440 [Spiroplasma sp.]|nr:hypothetical protein [Spiroplasma sp.]
MKRLLSLFAILVATTFITTSVTGCTGYDFGGSGIKPTPPPEIIKDIKYYEKLMKESESIIADFVYNINELKKLKNDKEIFPTIEDYNRVIAELEAEQASYQAIVHDCEYQILNLQTDGEFNPTEKLQAITYLQNELTQLQKELTTKEKYSDDYNQSELEAIKVQIKEVETILKTLLG